MSFGPPQTVGSLLGALDVEYADRATQEAAVARWFAEGNEPSQLLRYCLHSQGFAAAS